MSETKATVMVDYPIPDRYYAEDTEWLVEPTEIHDPGVLAAKSGAVPANQKEQTRPIDSF